MINLDGAFGTSVPNDSFDLNEIAEPETDTKKGESYFPHSYDDSHLRSDFSEEENAGEYWVNFRD